MLDRIARGEVRVVMFLESGSSGELVIVDQERGLDLDSMKGAALCGTCYHPMDLFSSRSTDDEVLHCMEGCGLRVVISMRLKAASDLRRSARRVRRENVCGRCLGEKHISMTPNIHGTMSPVCPASSENVPCPQCQASGTVA